MEGSGPPEGEGEGAPLFSPGVTVSQEPAKSLAESTWLPRVVPLGDQSATHHPTIPSRPVSVYAELGAVLESWVPV